MANENIDVRNRTLSTTRVFNAELELVWKVWSDINHLNNWWGPRGFTQTTSKYDFVENGVWSFVMHGPDGVDYQNDMIYSVIIPMKKIVLRHDSPPEFTVTALFKVIDSKRTQVDFIQVIDDQKVHDIVKDFAIVANMEHQMKFEEEVAKLKGEIVPKEFTIAREFGVDLDTMWKMFTLPELMSCWYGPKEIKNGCCDMDFRRGGHYHFSMIAEDKSESWGKLYYIDIVKNVRLIYLTTFSNASGEITRHPMAPLMPAELLTTVNFIKMDENKSKIEIRWYPINALPEEIKMFNDFHESFNMGWSGSLDRLESCL